MCISLRPSTYFMGFKVNLGSFVVMGVKSLFWYQLYSTLSWARSVAGWETTLSRARSVAGWETKLRGVSHWMIAVSSLSILNFQNAITRLGYMVGQNISGQGTCRCNDITALVTLPAQRGRVLYCYSFFFFFSFLFFFFFLLSSSSICRHVSISETLCTIVLILRHNNKSASAHFWHDMFGVKGHVGVTGVKSPFSPNAISPSE